MGSQFHEADFDGNLTNKELISKYNALVEEERYEYGNGSYSGTFATLSGIQVLEKTFSSRNEAVDYICDHTEKRGAALAVKYKDTHEVTTSSPTFNGKKVGSGYELSSICLDENDLFSTFGMKKAKCIAVELIGNNRKYLVADQLAELQKARLKEILDPCVEENRKFNSLSRDLKNLLLKAGDLTAEFTAEHYKSLKTIRKELLKTKVKRDRLLAKLQSLDERFGSKLYKTTTEDRGTKWLVGGWCAS
jgi:hypothetical protein